MSISISNSSNILHTEDKVKNLITFSHTFTLSNGQKISTNLSYNSKDIKDIEKFKETLLPTITKTVEITISYGLGVKADKFVLENNKLSRFKDGTQIGFKGGTQEKIFEYKTDKDLDDFFTAKKQKLEAALPEKSDKKERLTFINAIRKFVEKPVDKSTEKPADKPAEKPAEKPADKPVEKPADKPAEKPADKPVEKPSDESIADLKNTIQNISKTRFVAFYKNGPTAFLSNFAPCNIQIFEHTFKCAESAFQWKKYQLAAKHNHNKALENDPELKKFFTATGEEAFELSKALDKKYPDVYMPNWKNGEQDKVMWDVLHAKFKQNDHLMELLKATGTAYLLEHNQVKGRDDYWSDDHDGTGVNMLGKMLAEVRDKGKMPKNDRADQDSIQKYAKMYIRQGYKIF